MKRIAITVVTVMMSLAALASPVHYFTRSQANRAVDYLNRQNEVMIYCGYDYEIETYVLVNEIWAERINSAYYELWIYGYDAYTGEEVYMPLELQCVWLYSAGRMYNAAQYLRFRTSGLHTPQIVWYVPEYRPFTRVVHHHGYVRTYHYDVHRHGWRPPMPPPHVGPGVPPPPPIHPYYMRAPHTPAPRPAAVWTPGAERPRVITDAAGRTDAPRTGATTVTTRPAETPNSGTSRTGATTTSTTGNNSRNATGNTNNSRNSTGTQTVSGRTGATTTTTTTHGNSSNNRAGSTTNTTTNNGRSGATTTTTTSSSNSAPARAANSTTPSRSTTRSSSSSSTSTATPATPSNSSNSRAASSTSRTKTTTTTSSSSNTRNSSSSTTSNTRTGTSSNNNTRNSGSNTGSRNAGRR